jgi:hypothetical protein
MSIVTQSAAGLGELMYPTYWLVSGLDWRGDGLKAEAAVAVAPTVIPREVLSLNTPCK